MGLSLIHNFVLALAYAELTESGQEAANAFFACGIELRIQNNKSPMINID